MAMISSKRTFLLLHTTCGVCAIGVSIEKDGKEKDSKWHGRAVCMFCCYHRLQNRLEIVQAANAIAGKYRRKGEAKKKAQRKSGICSAVRRQKEEKWQTNIF